jgi:carboxymethylenebutenolidase
MPTHITFPSKGDGPVVLLLPPIFGVTRGIEEFADRIARHGFVVLTPDMFWRTHPGPLGYEGADRDTAQQRYRSFGVAHGMADLRELVGWVKSWPVNTGPIGVVGLCFGGRYAFLAAAGLPINAGVSFHGTLIGHHLDQFVNVACPLSLHFGEEDNQAPMEEVASIEAAASNNPYIEIHRYPKAKHGFMQHDRPSYLASADLAFARGIDLLNSRLNQREQTVPDALMNESL